MENLEVSSPAFQTRGMIPSRFTCDGENLSPPIAWGKVPAGTQSLVLIMEDPDIPLPKFLIPAWIHWIVYNIPPDLTALPEAQPQGETLANGAWQGRNAWRRYAYGGPCPPFGKHRYFISLYALDTAISIQPEKATKRALLKAMQGHVLAEGELMGTYARQKR